jgi:2'-5' RNA ligase
LVLRKSNSTAIAPLALRGGSETRVLFSRVLSSKRLFLGLDLPSSCETALLALDPHLTGMRWLPEEQLHLTLSFLGDVEAPAEDRLREVRVPPFFLPLRGVGVFNSRGRPSVAWAGVGKGHPHLFVLHRRLQDAVLYAGLEANLKPFHLHVTVGRAKGIFQQALQPFLRSHEETEFGLVKGDRLCAVFERASGGRDPSKYRCLDMFTGSGTVDEVALKPSEAGRY